MILLLPLALAYETDQLTRRIEPLRDALEPANDEANRLIAQAIARTNAATGCRGSSNRMRRRLADEIYRLTAHEEYVRDRGEFSGLGFGAYSAWLEQSPEIDRRDFRDRTHIYGEVLPKDALILGLAGVCATINLGGVLMGTDKADHFWDQGYAYFIESREGRHPDWALRWGADSERGAFGLLTSNAFSYADLYANLAGYEFYRSLLTPMSRIQRTPRGCIVADKPFDWKDWVDDALDEVLDPSLYTPLVGAKVREKLWETRDEVCAGYRQWGKDVATRRAAVMARRLVWATPDAPPADDPFLLDDLCVE